MAVAAQLFRLEQLDAAIQQSEAELASLRRRQAQDPELKAVESQLEALRTQEAGAASEQRRLESDLSELEAKIERDQRRMYGGQIVDPRELVSLEKELDHLRAQRESVEERCLQAMERLEELQSSLVATSRRANELRDRRETDRPELARQSEQLAGSLAGLREERTALAATIEPQALNLYQRLRAGSGHAVSAVSDGICQWCRVAIPPKDVQHARGGALVVCTNCARILYTGG